MPPDLDEHRAVPDSMDWLSRLLELTPVRGQLELRCLFGAPWRMINQSQKPTRCLTT